MTPHLIDHIAFVILAVVFPIWGYFETRKRYAQIEAGRTDARMGLYRKIIVEQWLIAIALLVGWFALGRGAAALGLTTRGGTVAWIGYGLFILACATLLIQLRSYLRSPERLASMRETFGKVMLFLPHTRRELRAFDAVSVTAGICEEIIYRGFLIAYLMAVLTTPFWIAALLSCLVFGLSHNYQGPAGILRTAAVGGVLALLYGLTGSLLAPMVFHAVMDITSGRIAHAAIKPGTSESSSPQLAA